MAPSTIELTKTSLPHIFLCDIDDSGLLKEIMVVKQFDDGSLYYIDIGTLHDVDKSRIKRVVTSQHATKYEAWELLSQATLNNGMNALYFFHSNNIKVKRPKGAKASQGGGLQSIKSYSSDAMIGSDFTDPSSASA